MQAQDIARPDELQLFEQDVLGRLPHEQLALEGPAVPMPLLLAAHAQIQGNNFLTEGRPISAEVFFGPDIFLPAVIWEAQILGRRLMDADLGCRMRAESNSLLGVVATVPMVTGNLADIMRALFCIYAAKNCCAMVRAGDIEMGYVVSAYREKFAVLLETASNVDGEIQWPQQTT